MRDGVSGPPELGDRVDHRNLRFAYRFPDSLKHIGDRAYLIRRMSLDRMYARIATGDPDANNLAFRLTPISKTPHYEFVMGNRGPYQQYLKTYGERVGHGIEHSVDQFERLLSVEFRYLAGEHHSDYIAGEYIRRRFRQRFVLLEGVHRASILLAQGRRAAPVAVIREQPLRPLEQFDAYLADYKDEFLEWYTPIELEGRVIHERTYPSFKERPEFLVNRERGRSKWEYSLAPHMPDLAGHIVYDVGCNVGLYSLYIAQAGARRVIGIDRDAVTIQPTNPNLPRQDVVQQAYFVKNLFELATGDSFDNVEFRAEDIATFDFSTIDADVVFSSCVLYHFGRERFEQIIAQLPDRVSAVVLQSNTGHVAGELGELVRIDYQAELLRRHGFRVRTHEPPGYAYPVAVGVRS
jgi:SAM-dependent methyltransferase